ncbi:MAG: toll/interleukin-1 receptor domain-containing protein, partial [Thaumarchaeota archaeon]|nr:toll/interleukin-1 receptor domain-containing protein [Nitrososphaerota archaeon]
LEISKRIRNLLRVGYKDGEKRADQFTVEGRNFYTNLQNQKISDHAGYSLKESRFAHHVGWHRIKVKEYLDELKLIYEISRQNITVKRSKNQNKKNPTNKDAINHSDYSFARKIIPPHYFEKLMQILPDCQHATDVEEVLNFAKSMSNRVKFSAIGTTDLPMTDQIEKTILKRIKKEGITLEENITSSFKLPPEDVLEEYEAYGFEWLTDSSRAAYLATFVVDNSEAGFLFPIEDDGFKRFNWHDGYYTTKKEHVELIREITFDIFNKIRTRAPQDTAKKKTPSNTTSNESTSINKSDVFICHAHEDKDAVARPLANKLRELGLSVWYDEFNLRLGKSIRGTIDEGLKSSSYGVVILSKTFFAKEWTKLELDALVAIFNTSEDRILPIRYGLTPDEVSKISPILAGIFSRSWDEGLENLANEVYQIATGQSKQITTRTTYSTNHSNEFEILLDKFTENGIHHVGIKNAKGKAIRSCTVQCERKTCIWWDDFQSDPRNIPEGGGGNIMLPLGFANTNPNITVLSFDNTVEQIALNKIPRRQGSKWNAKDDDDVHVERIRSSLNRIISELANISSTFQIFLNYKKGKPIDEQMKMYLSQKDDSVERLQNMTNQSAHLLEPDWMNDINDLCVN